MQCVLDGGRYFEGPRWHAGRLWFVDCWERTLLSLSPSGEREQHAKFEGDTPCGTGILPDRRLVVLTMFRKHLMSYADGRLSPYADLSGIATGTIDDMIIDGLGRAYVGDLGFDMPPPPDRGACGRIILVMPDGAARVVAEGLRLPNGIAVSADRAEWRLEVTRPLRKHEVSRWHLPRPARRGVGRSLRRRRLHSPRCHGRELQRIEVPGRRAIACALGGTERRTLFCLSAATSHEELRQRKSSARIDVVDVEVAGAGYP